MWQSQGLSIIRTGGHGDGSRLVEEVLPEDPAESDNDSLSLLLLFHVH